jgi:aspartyl-tRNA(Asn)/glutamyl-tRNA(Gln) amidotransferase subunit C
MSQISSHAELTRAEVDHVAELARLALTDEEAERYRAQLTSILAQVATLDELDAASISPSASVHPLASVMEDDVPVPSLPLEAVLRNAPEQEDGQFRVPPVFDE